MDSREEEGIDALRKELGARRRAPEPRRMGDVLNVLIARRGYAQVQTAAACGKPGKPPSERNSPGRRRAGEVRRGVLEVVVSNSTVLQELSFRKQELVERLAQLAPAHQIGNLRFRVGEVE